MQRQRDEWAERDSEDGGGDSDEPTNSKAQHYLEGIALAFGVLFIINGPVLFLPAARGSLINTFLGVKYGVAIKWHRCAAAVSFSCAWALCERSVRKFCRIAALSATSPRMRRDCLEPLRMSRVLAHL